MIRINDFAQIKHQMNDCSRRLNNLSVELENAAINGRNAGDELRMRAHSISPQASKMTEL